MPVLDGFAAAKQIREILKRVPILMLSMHAGREVIRISRTVPVQGFITKSEVSGVLLNAVDVLLAGELSSRRAASTQSFPESSALGLWSKQFFDSVLLRVSQEIEGWL